jgi:hypothetical protein
MDSPIDRNVERLSGGLDRPVLVVAGVATLGLIMAVLDTTIVNVAIATLSRDLGAPLGTIQWVSTSYLLSLAAVIPLSGWVTERFGSKRTWIGSIVLFAAGSALCALATSAGELIAFRVLPSSRSRTTARSTFPLLDTRPKSGDGSTDRLGVQRPRECHETPNIWGFRDTEPASAGPSPPGALGGPATRVPDAGRVSRSPGYFGVS